MVDYRLIPQSVPLHELLWQYIGQPCMPSDIRSRFAAGAFRFSLDCHAAMTLLAAEDLHGPCFSLIRTVSETLARGYWCLWCAGEERLRQIAEDPGKHSFPTNMLADIRRAPEFAEGRYRHLKDFIAAHMGSVDNGDKEIVKKSKAIWKSMNSYTHGSYSMIVNYQSGEAVEPNFGCGEIEEVMRFADACGCWAAIGVCEVVDNDTAAGKIYNRLLLPTLQT